MNRIAPPAAEPAGTLLWIGDRNRSPFRRAYRFCDAHVSGLAYRPDLASAIRRPAPAVKTVLLCVENDSSLNVPQFDELCGRHADARTVLLLGPLCGGARPSPAKLFATDAIDWHHWQSQLPGLLSGCGVARWKPRPAGSIAVVANRYANASALLAVAGAQRIPAAWCRGNQLGHIQNIDQFWWDDSAASLTELPSLLESSRRASWRADDATHVWIANDLSPRKTSRALDAGVDTVIAKPGDLSRLLDFAGEIAQPGQSAAA